jgi:hypothetical protein
MQEAEEHSERDHLGFVFTGTPDALERWHYCQQQLAQRTPSLEARWEAYLQGNAVLITQHVNALVCTLTALFRAHAVPAVAKSEILVWFAHTGRARRAGPHGNSRKIPKTSMRTLARTDAVQVWLNFVTAQRQPGYFQVRCCAHGTHAHVCEQTR